MVRDLRGMFAFGLWDTERRGLLLARDPYGIKPLYYSDDGWTLRFASQVKALIVTRGADGSIIYAGGERIDIPCVPAKAVVDPTGERHQPVQTTALLNQ